VMRRENADSYLLTNSTVMLREGGASSNLRPLDLSSGVSGILDRPVKPDDDSGELFDIRIMKSATTP
ncbi:hypothetical protein, partial [Bradyrhizobium sp. Leo170]|uniref:hypothetical protein n=1 Tax=Bradyrhizobium sp. Leo170 TaxID=1571199 RepID=UPI0010E04E82